MAWATGRGPSTLAARVTAPTAARCARRLLLGVAAGAGGRRWSRRAACLLPDPGRSRRRGPGPGQGGAAPGAESVASLPPTVTGLGWSLRPARSPYFFSVPGWTGRRGESSVPVCYVPETLKNAPGFLEDVERKAERPTSPPKCSGTGETAFD